MKRIITNKLYEAICEAIDDSFYHADKDKYSTGDKITKDCIKDGLPADIAEIYSKKTGKDISHIIYMKKGYDSDYEDANYIYKVKPSEPLRAYMDYSAHSCMDFLNHQKN